MPSPSRQVSLPPSPRLSDAPGRSPNHRFDRSGQSDDVRHADGYSPGPATRPDDPARTAGPIHGRYVPVLPEHGHDAAPTATAGWHAGHARDAEHARHAAGRAHESSGTLTGARDTQAKLIRVDEGRWPASSTVSIQPCATLKGPCPVLLVVDQGDEFVLGIGHNHRRRVLHRVLAITHFSD